MAETKAKKVKQPLERDILNSVCQYLSEQGLFFWRSNNIPVFGRNNAGKMTFRSMPKHSLKGVPDIIVIVAGSFIGLEIKRPNAELRPDQITFRAKCIENGGHYHVIHSLDEVRMYL